MHFRHVVFIWIAGFVFMFGVALGLNGTAHAAEQHVANLVVDCMAGSVVVWIMWRLLAARSQT